MNYILGIDQGGTKTAAAITDENGNFSGAGYAGGAYFPKQTVEHAVCRIKTAVDAALNQARLAINDINRITAGITGVDYPGDDEKIRASLEQAFGKKEIHVYNDAVIALYSGTTEGYGAAVCAGTGLNAAVCKRNGGCFVFGDYLGKNLQGASAIAQRGIRAVFDTNLGIRHAEKLTGLFLHYSVADTVEELMRMYMQNEDFQAGLRFIVPEMIDLAKSGDQETDLLLLQFAEELSVYITAGLKNAALLDEPVPVVLTGSVLKGENNPLTRHLIKQIHNAAPKAVISNAAYEPVAGACIMGLLQIKQMTPDMKKNLADSAEKLSLLRV